MHPSPHENVISLRDLAKVFRIYPSPKDRLKQSIMRSRRHYFTEHQAVRPLSLDIHRGETLGIIGSNGSGKSTLLQMICGTLEPTGGTVETKGRISALLELGAGFNPDFSGHENIYLNGAILGLKPAEIAAKYDGIVAFSGLAADQIARPVHTYSSGMYVRLAFAVAIAVEPDILIVDEALAVGDEAFQRKCFARIRSLQENGSTILFVSHSAQTLVDLCNRAVLMDKGELILEGMPKEVIAQYHRMIFAPEKAQAEIRSAILARHHRHEAAPAPVVAFDAPASRVEYTPAGGTIEAPVLLDLHGEPCAVLEPGAEYVLRYRVRFTERFDDVRFGMMVKTRTGIELAGAVCHAQRLQLDRVEAGQMVEVAFRFANALNEGAYFFNCGVTQGDRSEDLFIHRIVDAVQCRVLPRIEHRHDDMQPTGLCDLDFRAELAVTQEGETA